MTDRLLDLIHAQRSCRRFDSTIDVPDADLEVILDAAVYAPSAENSQPWEFVVVRDEANRNAMSDIMMAAWSGGGADYVRQTSAPAVFHDIAVGIEGGLRTAPVAILVNADVERVNEAYALSSIFPATQNMLLTAGALGYGSCLTTGLAIVFADQLRQMFALPATVLPVAAVYLGRPAQPLSPPRRRPFAEVTHRERFGAAW